MKHNGHGIPIRVLCLSLIFVLAGAAAASADTLSLTFKADAPQLAKDASGYDVPRLTDFSMSAVPGRPMLPHRVFNIALPPDADWASLRLTVTAIDEQKLPGFFTVRTCPPDSAWKDGQWLTSPAPGEAATGAPQSAVSLMGVSQLRKWKFVRVEFSPFRYAPETGALSLIRRADIQIAYSRTGEAAGAAALRDDLMDDVARDTFLNYGEAAAWYAAPAAADAPALTPSDYVIITTEAIVADSAKLSAFIAHKQDMDHTVNVVTETTWGAVTGQSPNHKAEKIREWLKSNYLALGIKYVLLIGNPSPYESGEGDVPMKMCWPRLGSGSDEDSPTDYFYADLTGNWDKDADGYFGEWSEDMGRAASISPPRSTSAGSPSTAPIIRPWTRSSRRRSTTNGLRRLHRLAEDHPPADELFSGGLRRRSPGRADEGRLPHPERLDLLAAVPAGDRLPRRQFRLHERGGAPGRDGRPRPLGGERLRRRLLVGPRQRDDHRGRLQSQLGRQPFHHADCASLDDAHPAFTYQCSCTNAYPENTDNLAYSILKKGGIGSVSATRVSWFNTGVVYGYFDGSTTNSGIGYEYVKRLAANKYDAGKALALTKQAMTPESGTRLMNYYDFNLYGDPSVSLQKVRGEDTDKHAVGDFDGDGADEAAIDFGAAGAWLWNGGTWSQLTPSEPRAPHRPEHRRRHRPGDRGRPRDVGSVALERRFLEPAQRHQPRVAGRRRHERQRRGRDLRRFRVPRPVVAAGGRDVRQPHLLRPADRHRGQHRRRRREGDRRRPRHARALCLGQRRLGAAHGRRRERPGRGGHERRRPGRGSGRARLPRRLAVGQRRLDPAERRAGR